VRTHPHVEQCAALTRGNAGDYATDVLDRDPQRPEPPYRLAAIGREEAEDERLGLLERIFDPDSRRRRALVRPGWRCLEIGAGRGSMAVWLAGQVGERGTVVATDIDVAYLNRLDVPNLEVRRHNILEDPVDVLGPRSFDLVCSRLVLFWLVGRQEEAIRRMAECLRPGGWLVDEDGDWGTVVPVDPAHPLYERYHKIWRNGEWWAERGYDPVFGRKLPALFERCGLQNIHHEASAEVVRGTSAWGRWWLQTLEVMRATDRVADPTHAREEEYAVLTAPWTDPAFWFLSALLHGCSGQRPA
jgi:SAM-dependent methyltransferase